MGNGTDSARHMAQREKKSLLAIAAILMTSLAACSATQVAQSMQPTQPAPPEAPSALHDAPRQSATLPAELLGVWSRDDADGRAQCDRYRALPADIGESDEGWISLVGSLIITPNMIHEFSEYGEGNFNMIKEVEKAGDDLWVVKVKVGIDHMPVDDQIETYAYQIRLHQERLGWGSLEAGEEYALTFLRCGDVRADVYQIN